MILKLTSVRGSQILIDTTTHVFEEILIEHEGNTTIYNLTADTELVVVETIEEIMEALNGLDM